MTHTKLRQRGNDQSKKNESHSIIIQDNIHLLRFLHF